MGTIFLIQTTLPVDPDFENRIFMFAWLGIGFVVAHFFARQQYRDEDHNDDRSHRFLMYMLGLMWPILLLAMIANYFGDDSRRRKSKPPSENIK